MLNPQDPKIIERYKALPRPLKDALWAEETIDHIFDVGKAQHLTVSQMGELADVVGLVILGILKPEDFGSEVQRKLNLTMERAAAADAIVAAINEKIFTPLREEIMSAARPASSPAREISSDVTPQRGGSSDVKEVAVSAPEHVISAPSSTSDVQRTSDVHPGVAQPVSIFAKNIPEPPRYQGQDPYREPIGGEKQVISSTPSDHPQGGLTLGVEQVKKPISWADISPEKEKATSHPDAKSALERALNNDIVAPRPPKPKEWSQDKRNISNAPQLTQKQTPSVPIEKPTPSVAPAGESLGVGSPPPNLPTEETSLPAKQQPRGYAEQDPYREPLD